MKQYKIEAYNHGGEVEWTYNDLKGTREQVQAWAEECIKDRHEYWRIVEAT